jgi:hypothetical protein
MNGRNMYSIPWHCNDFKNSEICEHMIEDGPKSLFDLLMRIVLPGPGLLTSLELYIPRNSLAPPRSQRLNMNFQNRLMLFYHQYMSLNPH